MKFPAYLRSLAARFLRRSRIEEDMEEELQSHIQHRADDLERSGLDRTRAERLARIELGGLARFREECRETFGGNLIETFTKDVRFSLRVLRKSPGFTIVVILTLALAIGANAVVFGVLNGLILRPLNVPQAESLYGIEHGNEHDMTESYPDYRDLRDRTRSFDGVAGFSSIKPDWIRAKIHPVPGSMPSPGTTSTCWAFSRTWAVSSTAPTSTAPTARRTSSSPMLVRRQDYSSEVWRPVCWPPSSIKPIHAIRWC